MADAPSAWTHFVAELKRRRVVRVAAVYLAASFVAIQAAPGLFQALLLPDWAFRLLVILLILGFLIAVPLAWAYDVGPSGIRRTPPADTLGTGEPEPLRRLRWWPVAAGLALVAVALVGWLLLQGRQPATNPRRVVVAAFENQTGDAALAPLRVRPRPDRGRPRRPGRGPAPAPAVARRRGRGERQAPLRADVPPVFQRSALPQAAGIGGLRVGREARLDRGATVLARARFRAQDKESPNAEEPAGARSLRRRLTCMTRKELNGSA